MGMMDVATSMRGARTACQGTRRGLLAAAAGFILGGGGLLLPASGDEVAARKDALGGKMGGRHGKNRRGRDQSRKGNNPNNVSNNGRGVNQLGGIFSMDCSVSFRNQSAVSYEVYLRNTDQLLECGPGFSGPLYAGGDLLEFVFRLPEWGEEDLQLGFSNPDIGEPWVEYGQEGICDSSDQQQVQDCYDHHPLDVAEIVRFDWQERSFSVERQSDSSDYKMFLVTALA
jgi:hypothetical protein